MRKPTADRRTSPLACRPPRRLRRAHPCRGLLVAAALLAAALVAQPAAAQPPAATANDPCASAPGVAAELSAIDAARWSCVPGDPCHAPIGERLAALAAAHPADVAVQRAWQDHALRQRGDEREAALAALREHFVARLAAAPDDPAAHYLVSRLAEGDEQREPLERALALDPAHPWAHLGLAVLRGRGRDASEADVAAAREHFAAFLAACPGRFAEPLAVAPHLGGVDFWRPHVPALRAALAAAPPGEQAGWLRRLWELEMAVTPPAEHDAVRQRIRDDVLRLDAAELPDDPRWWQARADGWERVGDAARREEADIGGAAAFPCGNQAHDLFQARYEAIAGGPAARVEDLSPEQRAALERLAREGLAACPDAFSPSFALFDVLRLRHDLDDDERRRAYEEHLRVWEANRRRIRMGETPSARVARELLRRGLDPARAAELARQEIETTGERDPAESAPAGMPPEMAQRLRTGRTVQQAKNRALLAEALLAAGDAAAAGEELARAEGFLAALAEPAAEDREELAVARQRRQLAALAGRIAEAEGRPADALAHYLAAVEPAPVEGGGAESEGGADGETDAETDGEAAEAAAARLWSALGGSAETLALLRDGAAAAAPATHPGAWQPRDEPLADFALSDLDGRTWQLADFAGKTILVNLWATWCVPCRAELPLVEELHRRVAGRDDLAVVTFNTDREIGLVAPYLAEAGWTFPVLLAADHVQKTAGSIAIPQTWIVDAAGRLRHFQNGYSPDRADEWVDEAAALLEATAAAPAAAQGGGR
jgi:thiol-disulfide isomerase/thioredoxin